ncbi:MAG: VWA domain-containing protein [Vicinamibacterales bacterium]
MALAHNLLVFGRLLRRLGLDVPTDRIADALRALVATGVGDRADVKHVLGALVIRRREDGAVFDAAFDAFWQDHGERWGRRDLRAIGEPRSGVDLQVEVVLPESDEAGGAGVDEPGERDLPEAEIRTFSRAERLRDADLADLTADELAEARQVLSSLAWDPGRRRTRRWVRGPGPRIDLRRALRAAAGTGEIVRLPRRHRTTRRRPIVVLVDVSGSMERYARLLLHFAHVLTEAAFRVEAFAFSTRLTRITRELRSRGAADAVINAARQVPDWSGGTRIGDALRELHVRWARYVLGRGAVVLVVSDGWDRGDPGVLRDQVARLQRSCHRLIWLSPLLGTADYRPLTRGLVAALPYVDDFLPVRTLRNLEDLAAHLDGLPARRTARRSQPSAAAIASS